MSRRAGAALVLVPTLAALITGGAWSARAQTPPAASTQQATTTTVPNLVADLLQKLFPTTTVAPPPTTSPLPAPDPGPGAQGQGTTPGDEAAGGERIVPPEAQRVINSVNRSGSSNSLALLEALQSLSDQGLSAEEAALIGMGQFPVAGEAYWSDDWYTARFNPTFHLHQGNDIFAARGTPARAPVAGRVEFASEGAGGLAAYVTGSDGTYYYMAHLDRFAGDVRSGASVKQGQVVGFVGSSGNAEGGSPHLHFEIHPGGGGAVNPKSTLDRWIRDALERVPQLLGDYQVGLPRPLTQAGMLRRLDSGSLGGPTAADGPQLWASNVRKDKSGVRVTAGAGGAGDPAYDMRVRGNEAQALEWVRAQQLARDVLAPLTPRVLAG